MGLMGVAGFRLVFDGRWPFDCLMLACLGLLYVLYLSLFVEFRLMYLQYSLHLVFIVIMSSCSNHAAFDSGNLNATKTSHPTSSIRPCACSVFCCILRILHG